LVWKLAAGALRFLKFRAGFGAILFDVGEFPMYAHDYPKNRKGSRYRR
jgi:hypothetical protein